MAKSHGKGHGKSWNFESLKEYKPCTVNHYTGCIMRSFINVFSRNASNFHWQAKCFELNFFSRKKIP